MINQVFWSLVNDPAQAGQPGAAYKDPTFTSPLSLSAACTEVRAALVGADRSLDKAAALSELMRSRRYAPYIRLLDQRWVWPVVRGYKSELPATFLPDLRDRLEVDGQRLLNKLLPSDGTFGHLARWYDVCRATFSTSVQPFDKVAILVSVYCHRGVFTHD